MTAIQLIIAKVCAALILCLGLFFWGHHVGASSVKAKWDASSKDQKVAVATAETKAAATTDKIVTQYVDRVQTVYQKGDTITKLVPTYVTVKDDSACAIPDGLRGLFDAASQGSDLPASPTSASR